jgi:hypothetical protein
MNRILRSQNPGWIDYAGLALFAIIFIFAAAFVISPANFVDNRRNQTLLANP